MVLFCQAGKAPSKLQIKRGATIKVYILFLTKAGASLPLELLLCTLVPFLLQAMLTVATLMAEFSSYYPNKALTRFDLSRLTSIVLTFLLAKSQPGSYCTDFRTLHDQLSNKAIY